MLIHLLKNKVLTLKYNNENGGATMKNDKECGAIVVEATISLTAFIFVIMTILSIVNIYYIQGRMSIALNSAAKEISQYTYLYFKFNADEIESNLNEDAQESRVTAQETIDGMSALMNSLSGVESSLQSNDFESMISEIESGTTNVNSLITMYASELSSDPTGFITGMGSLVLSDGVDSVKNILAQVLAKSFMEKNLVAYDGDSADEFLNRYHVVDGMDGLDFTYSSLMAYGESDIIQLVLTYEVEVIQLLNIDFTFTFRQIATTNSWGNGVSLISE